MSDKEDMIYETLKEMKSDQKTHEASTQQFRERTVEWMGKFEGRMESLDGKMENLESDMKTHIEGVEQNRASVGSLDKRLVIQEQPISVKKLSTIIIASAATLTAIITILKVLGLF
jgi:hypothetical protein